MVSTKGKMGARMCRLDQRANNVNGQQRERPEAGRAASALRRAPFAILIIELGERPTDEVPRGRSGILLILIDNFRVALRVVTGCDAGIV